MMRVFAICGVFVLPRQLQVVAAVAVEVVVVVEVVEVAVVGCMTWRG